MKKNKISNSQKEKIQKLDKNPQPSEGNKGTELEEQWKENPPNLPPEMDTPKTFLVALKPPILYPEQPEASNFTPLRNVKPKSDQIHKANSMEY